MKGGELASCHSFRCPAMHLRRLGGRLGRFGRECADGPSARSNSSTAPGF